MLEVEELVRLNRNTFRPRRRRLSGREVILQHLVVNQDTLVASTAQILDTDIQDSGGLRFEARGTGWVPAHQMEEVESSFDGGQSAAAAAAEEIAKLHRRIGSLEILLTDLTKKLEGQVPIASGDQAGAAAESGSVAHAETIVGDAEDPARAQVEAASDADADGEPNAAEETVAAPSVDFDPLKAPSDAALLDLVRGLVGDSVGMNRRDANSWKLETGECCYMAELIGDDATVLGALVMDLESTVRLAGGMLMEEDDDLDAQIEAKEPSEDIIDAAGEVLNTLTSAVNKTSGNAHVRAGALRPLVIEDDPWLECARGREDFSFSIGGCLAVLSR